MARVWNYLIVLAAVVLAAFLDTRGDRATDGAGQDDVIFFDLDRVLGIAGRDHFLVQLLSRPDANYRLFAVRPDSFRDIHDLVRRSVSSSKRSSTTLFSPQFSKKLTINRRDQQPSII